MRTTMTEFSNFSGEMKPGAPVVATVPAPAPMLAAVHPLTGQPRNFRVTGALFGGYKRGSIVPQWVVTRQAGAGIEGREEKIVADLTRRRMIEPTYDPVNVDLRVPDAKKATDANPEVVRSANELRDEARKLKAEMTAHAEKAAAAMKEVAGRDKQLGEQSAQIAALQEQLAARDSITATMKAEVERLTAANAELTTSLEAATAPAPKKTAK